MSTELFRTLPTPTILDTRTFEEMFTEVRAFFVAAYPAFANYVEGDPVHAALQAAAYSKLNDAQRTNDAYLQTLLAHASGDNLDVLAANFGVSRQTKTAAVLDENGVIVTPAVLETDAALRNRACLQWAGLGAGTNNWYKRHALNADEQVKDARGINSSAGNVTVYVQSEADNGGVVSADLLATVVAYLNDERRRILNDALTIQSIATVSWDLTAAIEFPTGENATTRLAELTTIVQTWAESQEIIGNDIRIAQLYAVLSPDFVSGVTLTAPTADVTTTAGQVPVLGTLTLTETV